MKPAYLVLTHVGVAAAGIGIFVLVKNAIRNRRPIYDNRPASVFAPVPGLPNADPERDARVSACIAEYGPMFVKGTANPDATGWEAISGIGSVLNPAWPAECRNLAQIGAGFL